MAVSAPAHPVVYLLPDATTVERDLIHEWAGNGAQASEAEIVARDALDGRLRQGDDPVVTPVRVAWLPRERDGARTARWSDFLAGHNPRRPSSRRQRGSTRASRTAAGRGRRARRRERAARALRRRDRRRRRRRRLRRLRRAAGARSRSTAPSAR